MVTIIGNGLCNLSSNSGQGCWHLTNLGKDMHPTILLSAMG